MGEPLHSALMRFALSRAIKPWVVNQPWGVYNPPVYRQFGFDRHNGIDVALGADATIYAPFAGTVIRSATKENGQWQPQGGGVFVSLLSDDKYLFDDGNTAYVTLDFLHCDHLLLSTFAHVSEGTALAVADNTGFSTGSHTHIQARRCRLVEDPNGAYVVSGRHVHLEWTDVNDANDSFDFAPYLTDAYASDRRVATSPDVPSLLRQALSLARQLYAALTKRESLADMVLRVCREEKLSATATAELFATISGESQFNPRAINNNRDEHNVIVSTDYGLCQLNSRWYIGPNKDVKTPDEALSNPEKCVRVMARAFKAGRADDWIAHRNGAYLMYLDYAKLKVGIPLT
jgi:hypothetical protein